MQIVLVVAATLVIVSLLAIVPLVAGRRRRHDADRPGPGGQTVLDREPGVGDDAGEPPQPGREAADVDLPDDRGVATVAPPEEVIAPRRRFRERLGRSRAALSQGMSGLLSRGADDDEAWEELEEALLAADVGVATSTELVERLRTRARAERASGPALRELLRSELRDAVGSGDRSLALDLLEEHQRPGIVLVVGVNGTGKTTTVGKLALALAEEGKQPVLAAADTFRAAATEQLVIWGDRVGAPVVRHQQGADPAAVAFDGLASARARGADVLLVDTAGRLHTKSNLMEELRKLRRVLEREGGQIREVLLVLDATTGQNGLAQARQFTDAVGVTGVVLTKLDGTAKGGIVIAVQRDLGIPVKLVGLGEGPHDLAPFDPDAFIDALLSDDGA
ncbi:MAG TPA: signal recognition particle-docking protein FtsY [Actinomycetota bacterium]|nr:signal recognition particle-docking protein FtsY [Actinomycetota bacterium]